jgi:hypothetical protein
LFLGSSITYGAGSFGDSFPDYLAAKDGVEVVKEAVSGTTLGGSTEGTYTSRLKNNIPMDEDFDLFVNFRLMTVVLVSQLVKSVIHFHLMILIEILLLALWNILLPMSSKSGSAL